MPDTVAKWKTKRGTKIFLVGTGHGKTEPGADVVATIRAVEPDVVVVPLCEARQQLLERENYGDFHAAAREIKIPRHGKKAELVLGDRSAVATLGRAAVFFLGELWNSSGKKAWARVWMRTIIRERNVWFALSLAEIEADRDNQERPGVVVGVVDVSRLPGVVEEWVKMEESNVSATKKDLERIGPFAFKAI